MAKWKRKLKEGECGVVEVGAQKSEGGSLPVGERAVSAGSVGGVERKGIRVSRAKEASKRCEDATQKDNDSSTVLVFLYMLSTL